MRSKIETALTELEAYEEGMRFQGLAVVLAKQRWPQLVASERKKDWGLDAYVTRDQADDGIGRGLACSITATYKKIASDAETVSKQMPGRIQQLIFATCKKVGMGTKAEWEERLRKEFDYQLVVISREEIVSSLTDPRNIGLCRTYLHLNVDIEPPVAELVRIIHEAVGDELANWARRVEGQPLIELRASSVDHRGVDRDDVWTTTDFATALADARRLVLEGPAGSGKTTSLIQLAQSALAAEGTIFLVDLPLWVKSGRDILSFVSGLAAFQRRGLTTQQLAQSESTERFYFLLNGWNEVSDPLAQNAVDFLRDLERQFPAAGILVATRAHYVVPPLPGATRLRLRPVGRRARSAFVRERLGEKATALLAMIMSDPALDDLTRTPFVLSEITSIVAAGGAIPRNRVGVIEAAIKLQEQSPVHSAPLHSAPIAGMSSGFLEALALRMTPEGLVSLTENEARPVVRDVSASLVADGQLLLPPQPAEILNVLSAHHVLERFEYPEPGYRFAHHLFEEYYAFRALERRFAAIVVGGSNASDADFIREFVNRIAWTQPLEMLAETFVCDSNASDGTRAPANALVDLALSVDPVFSAHIASIAGLRTDDPAAQRLAARLRDWYDSPDAHHRQCALAGMLASGMDVFRDIVEPLFASDDSQVRLPALRLWPGVKPSVLGPDWQRVVGAWSNGARATFVWEILHHRFDPAVSAFALADPSPEVKESAVNGLTWIGAEDEYARALDALDDTTLLRVVSSASADTISTNLRGRSVQLLRASLLEAAGTATRVQILMRLHKLDDSEAIANLKEELARVPDDRLRDLQEHTFAPAFDALLETDPTWMSEWVARRLADGRLWSEYWITYVTVISDELREKQFTQLATEDLDHRHQGAISILTKVADAELVQRVFLRLLEVWRVLLAKPRQPRKPEGEILRQLEALLRAIPGVVVVSGISEFLLAPSDPEFIEAFVHLYGRIATTDAPLLELDEPSRRGVRAYLRSCTSLILDQDDVGGEMKAEFASVLSQVGEPEDISDIMLLVRADLKRVRDGRAARLRGERTAAAEAAATSWTRWYVSAIVRLLGDNADDVLLSLFHEVEYEQPLLEEYARQFAGPERRESGRRRKYARIWQARAESSVAVGRASRRTPVVDAIRARIRQLEGTRGADVDDKHLNHHLKMLALGLAAVAPRHLADEIIALLSLPADFDAHICVEALEHLLFEGVSLPASKCLPLLDRLLASMGQWGIQDQDRWVIVRFLCICPFVDDPNAGLEKIRQVILQARLHNYDFRDLLPALANSKFEGALQLMLEMVPRKEDWRAIESEWIEALTDLETHSARQMLLGLVDQELRGPPFAMDWRSSDRAATRIAEMAFHDPELESRLLDLTHVRLDEPKRDVLAKVSAALGTSNAMLAALNLLDDALQPSIPPGVHRGIERAFIEERAHPTYTNVFTRRAAASNQLRTKLFSMATSDETRKRSAYSLLGQIEEWRLEYGRPIDESRHPDFDSGLPWPPRPPT